MTSDGDWEQVDSRRGDPECPECGDVMQPSPDYSRCKCYGCDREYRYRVQTRHLIQTKSADGPEGDT